MSTKKLNLSNNISMLLDLYKITAAELSRITEIPRATINRLKTGFISDPKTSTISKIAEYFNVSVEQLIGKVPIDANHLLNQSGAVIIYVPKLSWENFKTIKDTNGIFSKVHKNEHENSIAFQCYDLDNKNRLLFALEVNSNAMEPYFNLGMDLILDANAQAKSGDFVIVKDPNNNILLRKFVFDGTLKILKATNREYPEFIMDNNYKILGVVICSINNFV